MIHDKIMFWKSIRKKYFKISSFILSCVTMVILADKQTIIVRDISGLDKALIVSTAGTQKNDIIPNNDNNGNNINNNNINNNNNNNNNNNSNAYECLLECKQGETIVLDSDNNSVKCIDNKWLTSPFEFCQIKIGRSTESMTGNNKIGKYDIAPLDLKMSAYDIQVLYQAQRTKILYEFSATYCKPLRKNYITLQIGSNKTLWSTRDMSSCFQLGNKAGARSKFNFSCSNDVIGELTGQLIRLDLHCVYSFGTSIKSVNSCLMFKVLGNQTENTELSGICQPGEDIKTKKKTHKDINFKRNENESESDATITILIIGIIIVAIATCVFVFLLYLKRRKRLKTTSSRSRSSNNMSPTRSTSLRSQRAPTLRNGDIAVYEEIKPKENVAEYLNLGENECTDSEYLQPVKINNSRKSTINGKFDKTNENNTSNNNEVKDSIGYEILHPSHYQQYEPDYELMELNTNRI